MIKAGEQVIKYSDNFGCEREDIIDWIKDWVNTDGYSGQEETKEERLLGIKEYIKTENNNSITQRIKNRKAKNDLA